MILSKGTYFVTGIDTDAGKSYATGWLARRVIEEEGLSVITQKLVQTGCDPAGISEDIEIHRNLMGIGLLEEDKAGLTCAEIFHFPASPHLSAELEGREVDIEKIDRARESLEERYDVVLVEGAGGLMVPLRRGYLTIDYIAERQRTGRMGVLLVTSGRLGSLNHTLLSLEACRERGIGVAGVLFNRYPKADPVITKDTFEYIRNYLSVHYPMAIGIDIPDLER